MLLIEPKFCPICLTITFVSAAYFVATSRALVSSRISGISVPVWMRAAVVVSLSLLLVRHSLALSGRGSTNKPPKEVITPQIIGTPISKFIPSVSSFQAGTLYVVTQKGCSACVSAERDLSTTQLAWNEVPVCTMLARDGCFEGKNLTFVTPMLLMCDRNGNIAFQRNGWVASPQQAKQLNTQIQTVQKRLQSEKSTK